VDWSLAEGTKEGDATDKVDLRMGSLIVVGRLTLVAEVEGESLILF